VHLTAFFFPEKHLSLILGELCDTVDRKNPAPPGMYKSLQILGQTAYQLVQDFSHQQYWDLRIGERFGAPESSKSQTSCGAYIRNCLFQPDSKNDVKNERVEKPTYFSCQHIFPARCTWRKLHVSC